MSYGAEAEVMQALGSPSWRHLSERTAQLLEFGAVIRAALGESSSLYSRAVQARAQSREQSHEHRMEHQACLRAELAKPDLTAEQWARLLDELRQASESEAAEHSQHQALEADEADRHRAFIVTALSALVYATIVASPGLRPALAS